MPFGFNIDRSKFDLTEFIESVTQAIAGKADSEHTHDASDITDGTFSRERIESTDWAYLTGSASSSNYCRWRMVAGIVFVEVNYGSGAGLAARTSKTFGTIPSGYRPTKEVTAGAYLASTNNNISCLYVSTSGAVSVVAAAASSSIYGSVSYPI